jgi:hypothetical protein
MPSDSASCCCCLDESGRSLHDLHATILHLLGLDHQKLTCRYGGRDSSLTDIHGQVEEVLA